MENIHTFGRGDNAKVLWKYVVLALLWVIWQEIVESLKKEKRRTLITYGIESQSWFLFGLPFPKLGMVLRYIALHLVLLLKRDNFSYNFFWVLGDDHTSFHTCYFLKSTKGF